MCLFRSLPEVIEDPQLHARGALQWSEHPEYGRLPLPTTPLRFAGETPTIGTPTGPIGADARAVLRERLGLGEAELDALAAAGTI